MNLKNCPFIRLLKKKSRGTTFVEVLVAVSILSIIMVALWTGYSSALILIVKIPEKIDDITQILKVEQALRYQVSRIQVPFWVYEYEPDEDSRSVTFSYCDGLAYKLLTFSDEDDYIAITTSSSDEEIEIDPEEPEVKIGPFEDVEFEPVFTDEDGLVALEFKLTSKKEGIGEIGVYARLGCTPFWKIE